jgi:hypothetical protein
MMADASEPKRQPEAQKHVYLRERMRKYKNVLEVITFIIFSMVPLILWAMSWAPG